MTRQHTAAGRTRAVGVIIPANDEERLLPASLEALERVVLRVKRLVPRAHVVVVLDSCKDASAAITRAWNQHVDQTLSSFRVSLLEMDGENVGRARALGCEHVLAEFSDIALSESGSRPPMLTPGTDRLASRSDPKHDSGCGCVGGTSRVTEWPAHRSPSQRSGSATTTPKRARSMARVWPQRPNVRRRRRFPIATHKRRPRPAPRPRCGGRRIHYDASVPVATSARRVARAPHGSSPWL